MNNIAWCDTNRPILRAMSDDDIRRVYTDMCQDLYCEYTIDSSGNMTITTTKQRQLVGNYYRGRGLVNK